MTFAQRLLLTISYALIVLYPGFSSAQWVSVTGANLPRFEVATVVHDDKLFVFNGFFQRLTINNTIERYDPIEDEWTVLSSTEVGLGNAVTHAGSVKIGNELWLIGGRLGNHPGQVSDLVWIYNLDTNTWRAGPTLPQPFAGGGAGVVDNKIYLFGGMDPQGQCDVDHHYVYDLSNPNGWQDITSVAAMPLARNHFSTAVVGGKIYAIGGWLNHSKCGSLPFHIELKHVHAFDPSTYQWEKVADLPIVRSHAEPGTFVYNNMIYVVGGRVHGSKIVIYNPASDEWQIREDLELPTTLMATAARVIDDKLIVATGGENRPTHSTSNTRVIELPDDLLEEVVLPTIAEITGIPDPTTPQIWSDSYAVNGQCYCESGLDHDIGDIEYNTPIGMQTVSSICAAITEKYGAGPQTGRIYYNTAQCGHGPINLDLANDELICPGIPVAHRQWSGPRCAESGPTWRLDLLYAEAEAEAEADSDSVTETENDSTPNNDNSSTDNPSVEVNDEIIYRINAGGPTLITEGGTWMSDSSASQYYNTGRPWSNNNAVNLGAVDSRIPSELFSTERFDPASGPELSWSFPVTPGRYKVNLYFAEIFAGAQTTGARVFDINVENSLLSNIDVYGKVGSNTATVETLVVDSDGVLNIDFQRVSQNPAIKGIEIVRSVTGTVTPAEELEEPEDQETTSPPVVEETDSQSNDTGTPQVIYRVNAGGAAINDSEKSWISNDESTPFNAEGKTWGTNAAINTSLLSTSVPEALFQTERWYAGNTQWNFPVTPGQYQVTVYFAEIWSGAMTPGFREFSLQVEDVTENSIDVYKEVGANTALEKQFVVQADEVLNIKINKVSHNPSLKGIEIVDLESVASTEEQEPEENLLSPQSSDNDTNPVTPVAVDQPSSVVHSTTGACYVTAATLPLAKKLYAQSCSVSRKDCDPQGNQWTCSSENL